MRKVKVYVSLPISGRAIEDYTRQAEDACRRLDMIGFEPISPLCNGLPEEAPVSEHMEADYGLLLGCDAIFLCQGWEYSHGCMNELQLAADCRKAVLPWCMSDERLFLDKKILEGRV